MNLTLSPSRPSMVAHKQLLFLLSCTITSQSHARSVISAWRLLAESLTGSRHFGVLMPDGSVIHYIDSFRSSKGILAHASYQEFKNGRRTSCDVSILNASLPSEISARAHRELQKRKQKENTDYNMMYNNCESFARICDRVKSVRSSLSHHHSRYRYHPRHYIFTSNYEHNNAFFGSTLWQTGIHHGKKETSYFTGKTR